MRKSILFILIPILFLTGCGNGGDSKAQESFIAGDGAVTFIDKSDRIAAPKLSGTTLYGEQYTYEVGKIGVVNVWASWCAPCRAEEPALSAMATQNPDIAFIGILTRDNPVNAEAFSRKRGMTYPTLIDDSLLLGFRKSLPANAIPSTVVIDQNGNVAARISGAITVASLTEIIDKVRAE
ncbi:TrxA Thiol-disulfide isomerase and thioredoxins [Candidatus Nanopelagicaceae bacterium]